MELIKPGTYIDFMRYRRPVVGTSLLLVILSLVSLFVPGPNFGIDFEAIVKQRVQEEVEDKVEEVLKDKLKDLFDRGG